MSNAAQGHTQVHFDANRSEAFGKRLIDVLNSGATSLMLSVGHRTGLFDVMASMAPATSAQIADRAGLQERYVREWLGAMTVGRIIDHDGEAGTYSLPPEHAAWTTRDASNGNLAVFAQYIPILGSVEEEIVRCFHNGGGVAYERYRRFHEVMAEDSGQTVLPALVDYILPLVLGLIGRLENGIRVLDVGCGRGKAVNLMARMFPNSRFVGYDLSEKAITFALNEAAEQGNKNADFIARDLSDFDQSAEPGCFDLVTTFDAIHDQANPRAVLRGIRRSLVDDGVYLAQDIKGSSHHQADRDHPIGPLLYTVSCMHCMTVSLAQGGEGLGAMWGREKALEYMRSAGFSDVQVNELPHDIQNYYYVCRP
ncbi:MAG: class I SAM-dependent methyltransferase [Pseudolabrys sp.]|jgi:2-polyprenyl-3-methyl-5-hydroxy-6-metoxy-1,4-benzoquinol methylase